MTMRPLLMTMRCDLQRGRHAFRPLESRGGLSRSIQFPIRSVNIFQVEREYSRGEQSPRTGIRNGNWGDGAGNTGLAIKGLSGSCQARTSSVIYSESFAAFSVFKADGAQVDQPAVEPTCLGILALRQNRTPEVGLALYALGSLQNADGSWPAFVGDDRDGCWTTALGVLALMAAQRQTDRLHSAVHWLLTAKGREATWLWRWRF